jgi:hypothetical protein
MTGDPSEIRTEHFQNTRLGRYRYINVLGQRRRRLEGYTNYAAENMSSWNERRMEYKIFGLETVVSMLSSTSGFVVLFNWLSCWWRGVKLSLCLTDEALRREGIWRSGCIDHVFLTSVLVADEWSASGRGCFTPRPRAPPPYPLNKRLGGRQNQSGRRGEHKPYPYRDSNSDLSAVQSTASRCPSSDGEGLNT